MAQGSNNVTAEALAATILPDAPGAWEITKHRQGLENEQQKVAAAQAATAQKAAAANQYKPKEIDFSQGYQGHDKIIAALNNEYIQGLQGLEEQKMMHPGDSRYDYQQTGSLGNLQLMKLEEETKRRIGNSNQVKAAAEKFYTALQGNDPSFTPEYVDAMEGWLGSKESVYDGAPQPTPEQFWDQEKWANLVKTSISADQTAWADANGGYIDEGTKESIAKGKVKERAMSLVPTARPYQEFAAAYDEMPEAERAKINIAAQKEGMNAVQYLAYKTLEPIAYTKTTKNKQGDPTFNNKWGSGWGNDRNTAERLVSLLQGISTGDPSIFTGTNPNFVEDLETVGDISTDLSMSRTLSDELRGMPLSTATTDTGAKIPVTIDRVEAKNGVIKVYRKRADGTAIDPLEMPQKDFASNITEELIEGSPELKRGMLYEVMKERNMIDEKSGYIKAGTPKPKTAQQLAEDGIDPDLAALYNKKGVTTAQKPATPPAKPATIPKPPVAQQPAAKPTPPPAPKPAAQVKKEEEKPAAEPVRKYTEGFANDF